MRAKMDYERADMQAWIKNAKQARAKYKEALEIVAAGLLGEYAEVQMEDCPEDPGFNIDDLAIQIDNGIKEDAKYLAEEITEAALRLAEKLQPKSVIE